MYIQILNALIYQSLNLDLTLRVNIKELLPICLVGQFVNNWVSPEELLHPSFAGCESDFFFLFLLLFFKNHKSLLSDVTLIPFWSRFTTQFASFFSISGCSDLLPCELFKIFLDLVFFVSLEYLCFLYFLLLFFFRIFLPFEAFPIFFALLED